MSHSTVHMSFWFYGFVVLAVLSFSYIRSLPDGNLHIVFCDVGQGDGIYIQFPDGSDMVVDGGPGQNMLSCLGTHMGFWDRTLELVALTHPQHDHYGGLQDIVYRYTVHQIILPEVYNNTDSYNTFIQELEKIQVNTFHVVKGDKILQHNTSQIYQILPFVHSKESYSPVTISVLWPRKDFIEKHTKKTYIKKVGGEQLNGSDIILSGIREVTDNEDINNFSLVLQVSLGSFDVLLTGDAEVDVIEPLLKGNKNTIELLKVPHHGSKQAVTKGFLNIIKPAISVLSVGKKNSYGHPDADVVRLLEENRIRVKRTDIDGTIEIVSDGEKWWVE